MILTPPPRPWMPLHRRRFELDYTLVPRTARPARIDANGRPRPLAPTATLARRRDWMRRRPNARILRRRIDQLTAEARAWVTELQESSGSRTNA